MTTLTTTTLPAEIDRALPKLNQALGDYQYGLTPQWRQRLVRDGNFIKSVPEGSGAASALTPGLFTITFETTPVPTQRYAEKDDGTNIRQITLHFNGDRKIMPPRTRTKFYFIRKLQGGMDARKICEKLVEMATAYRNGVASNDAKIQAESKAKAAAEAAAKALDMRKMRLKETEGKRDEIFQQLVAIIAKSGRIESQSPGQYLNLALPNNIRVKIAVDTDRVFLSEIDTPIYFDKGRIEQINEYLAKIGAL